MRGPVLVTAAVCAALLAACSSTVEVPTVATDQLEASPSPTPVPSVTPEPVPSESPAPVEADSSPTPEATVTVEPAASPAPTFDEVCAGRDEEAFIEVLSPVSGATVADGFVVTGCGNTFEATYLYRVVLEDGTVVDEGFGTMSCGTGCVGEFEQQLTLGVTGEVTLVVFEESAEDGSQTNTVEVTFTVT